MNETTIGLIGYGDILHRVFAQQQSKEFNFICLSRSRRSHPTNCVSIETELGLNKAWTWRSPPDIAVYTPTPKDLSDEGYKTGYLQTTRELVRRLPRACHLILISSTRVYDKARCSKEITESAPLNMNSSKSRSLIEMEQVAMAHPGGFTILRPAGIYGRSDDRYLNLLSKNNLSNQRINRVHASDLASFISFLINKISRGERLLPIYNVSDENPASQQQLQHFLLQNTRIRFPKSIGPTILAKPYKNSGFEPLFRSYREGLAHLKQ